MLVAVKGMPIEREGDPVRADLPTYGLAAYDPVHHVVFADIPAEDVPEGLAERDDVVGTETAYGTVIIDMSEDALGAWHRHLDERYRDAHRQFRPTFA